MSHRRLEGEHRHPRTLEHPNFPEVSGTSFPLLSTVLAGFAVTISIQMMLQPDGASDLAMRQLLALLAFLLGTLLFLASIVFAINAQANNYLPFIGLDAASTRRLGISDIDSWIHQIEHRWSIYHDATIRTFYGGAVLLLAGVNLIVWEYVGGIVGLVFFIAIAFSFGLTMVVSMRIESTAPAPEISRGNPAIDSTAGDDSL